MSVTLGEMVRERREELGLSLEDVVSATGIDFPCVSVERLAMIERDEHPERVEAIHLEHLEKALGLPFMWLANALRESKQRHYGLR